MKQNKLNLSEKKPKKVKKKKKRIKKRFPDLIETSALDEPEITSYKDTMAIRLKEQQAIWKKLEKMEKKCSKLKALCIEIKYYLKNVKFDRYQQKLGEQMLEWLKVRRDAYGSTY